ncbi:esterase/lipase family protein [Streptomyces erythrochromogenes]|uniref:esterase/lipase family protein n=1 Tax=Streptomyces erythrochromogenes TaxID=285574 RepID=UPI0034063E17
MYRSVVFVHGTGVRAKKFSETLTRIKGKLQGRAPDLDIRGVYWGDAHGVRLNLGGLSIPDYHRTHGGERESAEDARLGHWAVLYLDPWYDLRLLRLAPDATARDEREFLATVSGYRPRPHTAAALRDAGLDTYFALALEDLRRTPELRSAAKTVDRSGVQHRAAVATALVAHTLAAAGRDGRTTPVGQVRDTLHSHVVGDLSAQDRGGEKPFKKVAVSLAAPIATWYGRQHRGAMSDGAAPLTGDILRYQVHGRGMREEIAAVVASAPGDAVTLIGHSLGGIACVELLADAASGGTAKVDQLITVGSQASHLYELDALACLPFVREAELPAGFPERWLNVFDRRDFLSYPAQPVFGTRVQDLAVDNGQPFIESHSAYWDNDAMWEAVTAWIG